MSDEPCNPNPEDSEEDVDVNPVLSVYVPDMDEDTMTVRFYDASTDSVIDTVYDVDSGSPFLLLGLI
ncbi:MAG: hypothetical protein V5A64_00565 [Candidatus Thermoplasmatota archaeon]